ncbi:aminotransferase class I/II-fold pyridoxal phosphate-dependent enzyme [Streptomyces sp. NPDC017056]|uniref:aminotransferase class I/II-fold pyridoxal phosphate-dependent enzyme n=1 Tax=Streptomyces sp. NPDC017056 TaxID=3364973 RepID=UPI0037AD7D6F
MSGQSAGARARPAREGLPAAPRRPYDGFFDVEQIFDYLRGYLGHEAERGRSPERVRTLMYQYGPVAGQIREIIADSLRVEGTDVPAGFVVVTVGAQEAMLIVLRALVTGPDDAFLVSSPCFMGITGAARLLDIPVTPVEEDAGGFSLAALEETIVRERERERERGRRPRAFYVTPDHSNPSGTSMSLRDRTALLDRAARHDLLVVEDSPYRLVSHGPLLPTLKPLDRDHRVAHPGSFAKAVFPGARLGYVVADQPATGGRPRARSGACRSATPRPSTSPWPRRNRSSRPCRNVPTTPGHCAT